MQLLVYVLLLVVVEMQCATGSAFQPTGTVAGSELNVGSQTHSTYGRRPIRSRSQATV